MNTFMLLLIFILFVACAIAIGFLRKQNERAYSDAKEFQKYVQTFHNLLKQEQHDQRTHLEVLARLAHERDFEQIQDYVGLLQSDGGENAKTSVDGALGAALAYVKSKGEHEGITVTATVEASLAHTMLTPGKEMQLMVNVFSNALEAARASKDYVAKPFIDLEIRKQFGIIIVDIKNSCPPVSSDTLAQLYPKKHPVVQKRGLGTYLIRNAVQQAEGTLDFHVDNHTFHLAVRMPSVQKK